LQAVQKAINFLLGSFLLLKFPRPHDNRAKHELVPVPGNWQGASTGNRRIRTSLLSNS